MWRALMAAVLVAGCATIEDIGEELGLEDQRPAPDNALAAIQEVNVRTCPSGRTLENAYREGFGPQANVSATDIATTPLVSDPNRALRLRRIVVAPGGVIAWHDHSGVQGMALIVSGEMLERRNSCLDQIRYRAGDVAIEDAETAHAWFNDGDTEAVIIVAHVVPR